MATPSDKFTVSFNSDTSDSETEETSEAETETEEESSKETTPEHTTEVSFSLATSAKSPSPLEEEDASAEFTLDFSFDASIENDPAAESDITPQFTFSIEANEEHEPSPSNEVESTFTLLSLNQDQTPVTHGHETPTSEYDTGSHEEMEAELTIVDVGERNNLDEKQKAGTDDGPLQEREEVNVCSEAESECLLPTGSQALEFQAELPISASPEPSTAAQNNISAQDQDISTFEGDVTMVPEKEETVVLKDDSEATAQLIPPKQDEDKGYNNVENNIAYDAEEEPPLIDFSEDNTEKVNEPTKEVLEESKESKKSVIKIDAENNMGNEEVSEESGKVSPVDNESSNGLMNGVLAADQESHVKEDLIVLDGFDNKESQPLTLQKPPEEEAAGSKVKDRVFMSSSARRKRLTEEALQSPTQKKPLNDDGFEARISRAKAFIESTNGKQKTNQKVEEAPKEIRGADNESDQYVLGTVAVVMGDKKAEDVYTEADTQARPSQRRHTFEPPDFIKRSRSLTEQLTRKHMEEGLFNDEEIPEDDNEDKYMYNHGGQLKKSKSLEARKHRQEMDDDKDPYDPENTDELIKRILAEARGETYVPPKRRPREEDEEMADDMRHENEGTHDNYMDSCYRPRKEDPSTSLLERRIQAMKKRNAELAADNFDPRPSKAKLHDNDDDKQMVLYTGEDHDRVARPRSAKAGWRNHHQDRIEEDDEVFLTPEQGAMVLYKPPEEEDEESDPDEDPVYKTRRYLRKQLALPESAFMPQKSEDTDDIVRERTSGIRGMVAKQEGVLEELKKASESFDEIDQEIKAIREQFYESQERSAILREEIAFDMANAKQREEEQATLAYMKRNAPLPNVDYTKGYLPSNLYSTQALTWGNEHDSDEEDDPMSGPAHKKPLAITHPGYGGPVSRPAGYSASLDLGGEMDAESTSSAPSYRARNRPFSGNRQSRSMFDRNKTKSLMEDYEKDSDFADDASSRISHDIEDAELNDVDAEEVRARPKTNYYSMMNGNGVTEDTKQAEPSPTKSRFKYGIDMSEVDSEMEELSAKINAWRAKMSGVTGDPVVETNGWSRNPHPGTGPAPMNNLEDTDLGHEGKLVYGVDEGSADSGAYSWGSHPSSSYEIGSWRSALNSLKSEDTELGVRNGISDVENEHTGYSWRSKLTEPAMNGGPYSSPTMNGGPYVSSYAMNSHKDTGAHDWRSNLNSNNGEIDARPWRKYLSSDTNGGESSAPSYQSRYGQYGKTYSADDSDTSGYMSSPYGGLNSGRLGRSTTLSEYESQRPNRRARAQSCEPSTGFKSRFLDKVREKKSTGETGDAKPRDKPFKSRFLKSSFSTDSGSTAAAVES